MIKKRKIHGNNGFIAAVIALLTTMLVMGVGEAKAATTINATLEHTGATYYDRGETFTTSLDAEKEHYNNDGGGRGFRGQAAMKFTFSIPAGKTVTSATLTWSTEIYGSNGGTNNTFYYMNLGRDLDWTAMGNGNATMIRALHTSYYTNFTNVELAGNSTHTNVETDVTTAVQAAEGQGYVVLFVTNNARGADLAGKTSDHAPSLSITYVDKYTVSFEAGDDATCATTSLSCLGEGDASVTSVTLPAATDNNGAEFMGWYTAPLGGTRIGGAGDSYTPTSDITLYAQYNRAPTSIAITGESTMKYGTTTTLTATLLPSNTVNSGITWSTGNNKIATVDQDGVITTTGLGTVTITARATADPTNIRDIFSLTVESNNYSYTVNAVDGNGKILKELATGIYSTEPNNIAIPIPQYVLNGTTLHETARVNGNYYNYYITPNADGYVANKPYTNGTVSNVVYYTEAEECSALPIKVVNGTTETKASNDTIARNSTYTAVTELVPGTYTIYASAINGNGNDFTYKFKVGDEEVMSSDVTQGYDKNASSSPFTINEKKTLYVYCPAGNSGGLDYFYIVQDPVYHVTQNLQQFNFSKENIDNTTFTTANPINNSGNNAGTRNGVEGPFYNIKNKSNYVTITADGAIAFSIDAFHGNSKDTRSVHVFVDDVESVEFNVPPGAFTTSPIIATGGTGTHTIKITGDGKDVYPVDIVFYTQPVVPQLNYTSAAVKVGETTELTLRLPHGCEFTGMTYAGDASKINATFERVLDSNSTYRKGTLTLTGLQTTGNTPTSLTFEITGDGSVYLNGTSTISVDVLKSALTLAYSDGDSGNDATEYVCNADETTPALPTLTLTATDEYGNDVPLNNLSISYVSDDETVATVSSAGVITIKQPYGNGTAIITATATSANYDDAEAEYSITIQKGVNWKVATHPTYSKTAPGVRDTFHVSKYEGGNEILYLVGTFGGWNRNDHKFEYPPKSDVIKEDKWKSKTNSAIGVDGFSTYWSGNVDACNENLYNSLDNYYYSEIYGVKRYGWFKQPDGDTTHPFTLPVRGAYVTFEPTINGTLSVYIEQNGSWNSNKDDVYDNDSNFISVDANNVKTVLPGTAPFQFRPHAFFIVDQNGNPVEKYSPVKIITRTKVNTGIATESTAKTEEEKNKQNAVLETFCANYACEKGEKFKCILDEFADGYNDVTNIGNWKEFKEYMSAGEQQRVHDNWSSGVNGAQVITKLDNGAYLAIDKGMVKYTFHVIAGQTYYVFSNFSKIGFAGCNFVPDETHQPSGTLELSEEVAYVPSDLKHADEVNTVPMYETITLDRQFSAGKWNTICIPFTMTESEVENVFGKGTELIILDKVEVDEGHAQIFMTYHEIQSILAGYPYLIKPAKDVANIEVHNKAIDPNQQVLEFTNGGYTSKGVDGFCNPQVFSSALTGMTSDVTASAYLPAGDIYLANNTLYISRGKTFQKGYRSYLKKEADAAPAKSVSFGYFNAWEEDEGEVTYIDAAELTDEAQQTLGIKSQSGIYSITGQKMGDDVTKLSSGIYIVNGKKIVVE